MTVYVGEMFECIPNRNWRYQTACHMFADDEDELHELAQRIGLQRSWFQGHTSLDHYDLTVSKRIQAIAAGAVPADRKTEVKYIREHRCRKMAEVKQ